MGTVHLPEILLIVVVLLLIFGVGKISKIGGELGSGIRAFRDGLNGKHETDSPEEENIESDEKLQG